MELLSNWTPFNCPVGDDSTLSSVRETPSVMEWLGTMDIQAMRFLRNEWVLAARDWVLYIPHNFHLNHIRIMPRDATASQRRGMGIPVHSLRGNMDPYRGLLYIDIITVVEFRFESVPDVFGYTRILFTEDQVARMYAKNSWFFIQYMERALDPSGYYMWIETVSNADVGHGNYGTMDLIMTGIANYIKSLDGAPAHPIVIDTFDAPTECPVCMSDACTRGHACETCKNRVCESCVERIVGNDGMYKCPMCRHIPHHQN